MNDPDQTDETSEVEADVADPVAVGTTANAVIERPIRDPRITWTALAGAGLAIFGVFGTWASGSGVTLNGVEGSHPAMRVCSS